jgi:hypothetical protein
VNSFRRHCCRIHPACSCLTVTISQSHRASPLLSPDNLVGNCHNQIKEKHAEAEGDKIKSTTNHTRGT